LHAPVPDKIFSFISFISDLYFNLRAEEIVLFLVVYPCGAKVKSQYFLMYAVQKYAIAISRFLGLFSPAARCVKKQTKTLSGQITRVLAYGLDICQVHRGRDNNLGFAQLDVAGEFKDCV
jgi:hypothetical protein